MEKAEKALEKSLPGYEAEVEFVRMMIDLKAGEVGPAAAHAAAAYERGLPPGRLIAGPRELLAPISKLYKDEEVALLHGPMVGSVTDSSARFWVRTGVSSHVRVGVVGAGSAIGETTPDTDFTAVIEVGGLKPGEKYEYELEIDGALARQEPYTFTTFPKQGQGAKFSVGFWRRRGVRAELGIHVGHDRQIRARRVAHVRR